MKRAEILEAARVCVCGEREQDYGTPENNFETIGLLWGVYLRAAHPELARVMAVNHITAKDVAAMMGLLKVARIATGNKADSFVDLAGYAAHVLARLPPLRTEKGGLDLWASVKSTAVRCPKPVTPTSVTIACIWVRVTLCVTSTAWGRRKRSL